MSGAEAPILQCSGIVKSFGGVRALRGVDFAIRRGGIHGLVGENGAGKSTLTRIIAGIHRQDEGSIRLDGEELRLADANDALARRIVTIHQDINLIPSLSVTDNILLNNELTKGGLLRRKDGRKRVADLLAKYHLDVSPDALVQTLPNDARKMIQIIKAVNRDARILIMDEPTSSLNQTEVRVVLDMIRSLAEQGVGIVFISHYMSEIFQVCDDITVLRDGQNAAHLPRETTTLDVVVGAMLGSEAAAAKATGSHARRQIADEPLFEVAGLSAPGKLRDVGFTLRKGEVLGVTGLTGSGASDLAKAIFGSTDIRRDGGRFRLEGREVRLDNPHQSLSHRIALLTSDRLREGVLPDFSLIDNMTLPILDRFSKGSGFLDEKQRREVTEAGIRRLNVRTSGPNATIRQLSGGNQQKVLMARWLETGPKVLILDEPTIGIDLGAKAEIKAIIRDLTAQGVGVILVTTEIDEIVDMCDRVLILYRGALIREYAGTDINREAVLAASISGS
ncbi:sugar ABC transporter ATP-binding protein [Kaistia granuli]|uniref:sugar ABC transporter ATP-binding protein n=1 Tax=Kaistia granuli TaxID=363259 RepID=UPI000362F495|nr:sugar ABC transporter ATP-binding protein [Kaistia granuli]